MSDPVTPPPPETRTVWAKKRLPFEQRGAPAPGSQFKIVFFAAVTVACAAAAGYMALVAHMPLTDMRVVAPAVGALWFGLRIFMLTTPKL